MKRYMTHETMNITKDFDKRKERRLANPNLKFSVKIYYSAEQVAEK